MNARRRALCAAALLACAVAPAFAQATLAPAGERKAALVIGNGAYPATPLKNPVNDAQAIAASLRGLGFEVVLLENATLREMIEGFRRFSVNMQSAAVRVLFYAGHGVQLKGRNYLLPVDTDIRAEDELPAKSAD